MSIDSEFSGTTGVVGILRGTTLHVCNIGDSRVILGCRQPAAAVAAAAAAAAAGAPPLPPLLPLPITQDHKPDLPAEKARILAAGGRVHEVGFEGEDDGLGIARVWLRDVDIPGIAMSRSLGDSVVHTVGVSSAPEVHCVQLLPSHAYLVWASDGLWEFMSNEEVLGVVAGAERAAARAGGAGGDFLKAAVERMIEESSKRWLANEQNTAIDDTTVILVQLDVHEKGAEGAAGERAGGQASSSSSSSGGGGGSSGSSGSSGSGSSAGGSAGGKPLQPAAAAGTTSALRQSSPLAGGGALSQGGGGK